MLNIYRTLPPVMEATLALGVPAKGTRAYNVLYEEMRAFAVKGRMGLALLDRDLDADDIGAVIETLRTMHRSHAERMERIEGAMGALPHQQRAGALTLRWAPRIALVSMLALIVIDWMDMGGWHHSLWAIPLTCIAAVLLIHKRAGY